MTTFNKKLTSHRLTATFALAAGLALATGCPAAPQAPAQVTARKSALVGQDGDLAVEMPNTVINRYAALKSDAAAGDTQLIVENPADLDPLAAGDLLLVIQMQGAQIDSTDTESFGTVTSLGNAGKHELVTVASISGDTLTIESTCGGLQNSYSATGHVQIVRVPQLASLEIKAGASLSAPAWNGKVGGIVAVHVEGQARIDGDIDVSGKGFRGGATDNSSALAGDDITTFVSSSAADGAEKGEGIAGSASDYDAMGGRYGRGAPANGGGGNSYNAGGGGGANGDSQMPWSGLGVMDTAGSMMSWAIDPAVTSNGGLLAFSSGGGRGGYSFSDAAADPTMDAPGSASWGGNLRRERGGRGGHPVQNAAQSLLFMGGGGGAGDANDGSGGAGGRGGGLVYLVAHSVDGSGKISAAGQAGAAASGAAIDAAGGGGAGGSIVVRAESVQGVVMRAMGGAGGGQVSSSLEAAGPGGGGGGGFIALTSFGVDVSASGGGAGQSSSAAMSGFTSNGATLGSFGQAWESSAFPFGVANPMCAMTDIALGLVARNGMAVPGGSLTYTMAVQNRSSVRSRHTAIRDVPALGMAATSWLCRAESGATCPIETGSGPLELTADLPPGGTLYFDVTMQLPATLNGNLAYQMQALPSVILNDSEPGDNLLGIRDVLVPQADLTLDVQPGQTPVNPGQELALTVNVSNAGISAAQDLKAHISLPPGMVPSAAFSSGWQCSIESNLVTCGRWLQDIGAAPPITVRATVPAGLSEVVVQADVQAAGTPDPVPGNNSDKLKVPVQEVKVWDKPSGLLPEAPASGGCTVAAHPSPQAGLWATVFGLLAALKVRRRRRA
jgi:hypothetical protein